MSDFGTDNNLTLKGIGGWLVIIAIGVFVNPISILFTLLKYYIIPLFHKGILISLIKNMHLFMLISFEVFINLILFAFSIFILIMFIKKSKNFPILFVIYSASKVVFNIMDTVLSIGDGQTQPNFPYITGIAIGSIIWSLYMLKSRRVKNTFVN